MGTITEIYDYLRLLYAKIGIPYCPRCGRRLISQDINKMLDFILSLTEGTKIQILAPVVIEKKENIRKFLIEQKLKDL